MEPMGIYNWDRQNLLGGVFFRMVFMSRTMFKKHMSWDITTEFTGTAAPKKWVLGHCVRQPKNIRTTFFVLWLRHPEIPS